MSSAVQAPAPAWRRVAVLGTGLIGGSVAAALRTRRLADTVVACATGDDAQQAVRLGLADLAADSIEAAVADADLVIVATPVPVIPAVLAAVLPALSAHALVTDCASTKAGTVDAAATVLGDAFPRFVPGHPIAGSERSGPTAARADLFDGAWVVLTPSGRTDLDATARVEAMWTAVGARAVRMDSRRHDRLFAQISHWPHMVAFALCAAVGQGELGDDALRFAGAGLRDTSRVGASSPTLWADIVLDNREAVLEAARAYGDQLRILVDALEAGDRERLVERFDAASGWRRRMPPPRS